MFEDSLELRLLTRCFQPASRLLKPADQGEFSKRFLPRRFASYSAVSANVINDGSISPVLGDLEAPPMLTVTT